MKILWFRIRRSLREFLCDLAGHQPQSIQVFEHRVASEFTNAIVVRPASTLIATVCRRCGAESEEI